MRFPVPFSLSRWLSAALLGFALLGAQGQPAAAGGPSWAQLSPAQRTALAPLQGEWDRIEADRKQKWLEVASRFHAMSPERQARVRERMNDWARKTPTERGEARVNFQQSKKVPKEDKQARWEAYQALPAEERAALAARAKPASPASSPARALRAAPVDAQAPKSNIVGPTATPASPPRPVTPTVVQGNTGATTSLVTKTPTPPAHQPAGQPKIAASPKLVDRTTLLPKSGPQAAGARPQGAAKAPASIPAAPGPAPAATPSSPQ
ncbi:MAG: DUF3106 domain-containing protein [Vitreoscilla sp.]|nr:DUF3106 domain-containing protein [Vitreoscilla sp.]